jgi:hypothetical protein
MRSSLKNRLNEIFSCILFISLKGAIVFFKIFFLSLFFLSIESKAHLEIKTEVSLNGYSAYGLEHVDHYVGLMNNAAADALSLVFKDSICEESFLNRFVNPNAGSFGDGPLGIIKNQYHHFGLDLRLKCSFTNVTELTVAARSPLFLNSRIEDAQNLSDVLSNVGSRFEIPGVFFYAKFVDGSGTHFIAAFNSGADASKISTNVKDSEYWLEANGVKIF